MKKVLKFITHPISILVILIEIMLLMVPAPTQDFFGFKLPFWVCMNIILIIPVGGTILFVLGLLKYEKWWKSWFKDEEEPPRINNV